MRLVKDNASTVISSALTALDTTVAVGDGSRLPVVPAGGPDYAVLTIEDDQGRMEQVKCIERELGSDILTIERNTNNDPAGALAFDVGARIELRVTAGMLEMFYQRGVDDLIDANTDVVFTFKRFLVQGEVPQTGDLFEGEVVINIPDRKFWVGAIGATAGNPLPPILLADTAAAAAFEVTQPGHGFGAANVGAPVYFAGSQWVLAGASSSLTSSIAIIREITSANTFSLIQIGRVENISPAVNGGSPLAPGTKYYLSDTPGQIVAFPPTVPPNYDQVVMVALSETEAVVLPWQPGIKNYIATQNEIQTSEILGLIIALG